MPTAAVRGALEEAARLFAEDPDRAKAPSPAVTAVLEDGLSCRIGGPLGELRTDMPALLGGGATAPSPGWLLRGAIASCTASVIAMRAAQLGIRSTCWR